MKSSKVSRDDTEAAENLTRASTNQGDGAERTALLCDPATKRPIVRRDLGPNGPPSANPAPLSRKRNIRRLLHQTQSRALQSALVASLTSIAAAAEAIGTAAKQYRDAQVQNPRRRSVASMSPPTAARSLTVAYRGHVRAFLDQQCIVDPLAKVRTAELWAAYESWSRKNCRMVVLSQTAFGRVLTSLGFTAKKSGMILRAGLNLRRPDGVSIVAKVIDDASGS
jgi:hypothetical protein